MTLFTVSTGNARMSRRESTHLRQRAQTLAHRWSAACEGAGLADRGRSAAGLEYVQVPKVTHVDFVEPITLMVQTSGGHVLADFRAVSERLCEALGVGRLTLERRGSGWIKVTLDPPDPLSLPVDRPMPVDSAHDPVLIGRTDAGQILRRPLAVGTHMLVQGASGTGKSVFCYNLLSQVAGCRDVRICGVDPSGLLLAPFAESGDVSLGSSSVLAHTITLERLVSEMDDRIEKLPAGSDQVDVSEDCPLLLVVLEELPGLLRAAERHDAGLSGKGSGNRLTPRIRAAYGRLMAEGRKARLRLLIITQRADAEIVGGFERGQIQDRISFAVDSADALRMLHPRSAGELADEHMSAPPGEALVTLPGVPLARLRAPGDYPYRDYCRDVSQRTGGV